MLDGLRQWVLVPDPTRGAVLVVRGAGHDELPRIEAAGGPAGMLSALEAVYGLRAPYLRPALVVLDEDASPTMALRELAAPASDWRPTAGLAWLELERADPDALTPSDLAPQVSRWLEEQRTGRVPERRPPWARPGWLAEASRWIEERSVALGHEPVGEVELVAQWPISSVLKLATSRGTVFFKAVFAAFFNEPALTRALASEHPGLVPEVLAVDDERGWILMRELRGEQMAERDVERWASGLETAAIVHRSWVGRDRELTGLGVPDRSAALLVQRLPEVLDTIELSADDRRRAVAVLPELERLAAELETGPLRPTLVHGDLHPGNVMVSGDDVCIFDWSDGTLSHPLFDLPPYLSWTKDEAVRERLVSAYLACWTDVASSERLRLLAAAADPLAHAHHALSYLGILEALEDADRWWFVDEPRRWLLGAIERVEAMRGERPI